MTEENAVPVPGSLRRAQRAPLPRGVIRLKAPHPHEINLILIKKNFKGAETRHYLTTDLATSRALASVVSSAGGQDKL